MTDTQIRQVESIAERTMEYPFKVWGFGEGIALEALWETAQVTRNLRYKQVVLDVFERWLQQPLVEADHSAPGMLLLTAYQDTSGERYLDRAIALADYMLTLPRDETGAAFHRPRHPDFHDFIYVDCMEVDAPFLCKLAAVTSNPNYYDAGVHQILSYCELLQDNVTGLFFHQYDGKTKHVNGAFWGRGNGWALLGLVKTLLLLSETHQGYQIIKERLLRLCKALAKCQLPSGNWPTVLDGPKAYPEASLPAMFGYGIQLAILHKIVGDAYQALVDKAWQAMWRSIDDGLLMGVSVATPPGDADHYNSVEIGAGFPWGQGPALLFALNQL
jgi:unsaturated rhamnogalacturonyl hydrolase